MITLQHLPKTTQRSKKRLGHGYGSGKGGHTSSRGQKGQNSRTRLPIWFEGGQLPQIRRFPFIRGKSRFDAIALKPIEINVGALDPKFASDTEVTAKTLVAAGLVKPGELKFRPVKILGTGSLTHSLTVKLPVSHTAKTKIEAAGGKVIL
jgi:large subunit ribosomal protein L15